MRRLKNDRVNAVSASSELTNYGADYLLDEHPSRLWKADNASNARLTVDIVGGFSDLMLFGTNAESAEIMVEDPNFLEFGYSDEFGYAADEFANSELSQVVSATSTSGGDALHVQLSTAVGVSCVAYIDLVGNGSLYAGKIVADHAEVYGGRNPFYGLTQSRIDRSVQSEYPRYYSKRSVPKQWAIQCRMTNANANQFSDDYDQYGAMNHGWKITDLTGSEFLCYGYMSDPIITIDKPSFRLVSFYLREVK